MEIVRKVHTMRQVAGQARARGRRVGFVPTMGSLHDGHLALIRRVKERADVVVVSVFVNPTQFGAQEDFEHYPRDLVRDADLCAAEGVDYVFAPEPPELYPGGIGTWVEVTDLSYRLEGASRPGHFRGVATVVLKLLHVVGPHVAAFGEKDAQQLAVVRRATRELLLDVEILPVATVREADGLARSSRNVRLDAEHRRAAAAIPRALEVAQGAVAAGGRRSAEITAAAHEPIDAEPLLQVDYLEIVDPESFAPLEVVAPTALLVLAVFAGDVRLLDNVKLA